MLNKRPFLIAFVTFLILSSLTLYFILTLVLSNVRADTPLPSIGSKNKPAQTSCQTQPLDDNDPFVSKNAGLATLQYSDNMQPESEQMIALFLSPNFDLSGKNPLKVADVLKANGANLKRPIEVELSTFSFGTKIVALTPSLLPDPDKRPNENSQKVTLRFKGEDPVTDNSVNAAGLFKIQVDDQKINRQFDLSLTDNEGETHLIKRFCVAAN